MFLTFEEVSVGVLTNYITERIKTLRYVSVDDDGITKRKLILQPYDTEHVEVDLAGVDLATIKAGLSDEFIQVSGDTMTNVSTPLNFTIAPTVNGELIAGAGQVGYVDHGTDANAARPSFDLVVWTGLVVPLNAAEHDIVYLYEAPVSRFLDLADWVHAHATDGPEFFALDLGPGDPVTVWPDEVGNLILDSLGANAPVWTPAINSVVFTASLSTYMAKALTVANPQPNTLVLVGRRRAGGTITTPLIDGMNSTYRHFISNSSSAWSMNAGASLNGGVVDTNRHVWIARFNGASSSLLVDGIQVAAGNAGDLNRTGLTVGSRYGGASFADVDVEFIGHHDGTLTTEEINAIVTAAEL